MARIYGKAFTLFGAPDGILGTKAATQTSISYTSTHTTVTLDAGDANFSVDFFSPVSPKNPLRQSLPFIYVIVTASGTSGLKQTVQIFSSTDDNWTGGQGNFQLDHQVTGNTSMFNLTNPSEILYAENEDMAAWGSAVLVSTENNASFLTYQSGSKYSVL